MAGRPRRSNNDIYAQRVNASGGVQWTANGVAISEADYSQSFPRSSRRFGRSDRRVGGSSRGGYGDIYAQRVNASGGVQWATGESPSARRRTIRSLPQIASDGSGGGIVAWAGLSRRELLRYLRPAGGRERRACNGRRTESPLARRRTTRSLPRSRRTRRRERSSRRTIAAGPTMTSTPNGWERSGACGGRSTARISARSRTAGENLQIVSDGSGERSSRGRTIATEFPLASTPNGHGESDLAPICSVEPLAIDLAGTVLVGGSRDTTFTIANPGVGLLTGSVSEACDQFQIISGASYSLSRRVAGRHRAVRADGSGDIQLQHRYGRRNLRRRVDHGGRRAACRRIR